MGAPRPELTIPGFKCPAGRPAPTPQPVAFSPAPCTLTALGAARALCRARGLPILCPSRSHANFPCFASGNGPAALRASPGPPSARTCRSLPSGTSCDHMQPPLSDLLSIRSGSCRAFLRWLLATPTPGKLRPAAGPGLTIRRPPPPPALAPTPLPHHRTAI